MRLLKLGVYHPTYLRHFYTRFPELNASPYAIQHGALIDDCFGSSDFWTHALGKLQYETAEIIANAEPLQRAWASEHALDFDPQSWMLEIASAQIRRFRPDVLLVADYSTFKADFLQSIRLDNPSIRLLLGWCGAPYFDSSIFRQWDAALSCVPELVADFRAGGLRSYHVDHAFDARVLEKLKPDPPSEVDFAFVGSIVKLDKFHIVRERLLLHLVERTNLEIWSDLENTWNPQERESSARKGVRAAAGGPRRTGTAEKLQSVARYIQRFAGRKPPAPNNTVHEKIVRRAHPPVYGLEMLRLLRRSRVVFNNHIDLSHANASNMRLFEATGVGACLLTDRKQNLSKMFEPEKEVLTYGSAEECVEKVRYILDHGAERLSIAVAGQARTLRDHNFDLRAAKIDEVIRSLL